MDRTIRPAENEEKRCSIPNSILEFENAVELHKINILKLTGMVTFMRQNSNNKIEL